MRYICVFITFVLVLCGCSVDEGKKELQQEKIDKVEKVDTTHVPLENASGESVDGLTELTLGWSRSKKETKSE